MNGKFGMAQLGFVLAILCIISLMGYLGFGWLESRMGWQMAFAMFMMIFIVAILFGQQYLSMAQLRGVLENIVSYNSANAKVDAYKQATVLEGMKVTRQVMASDSTANMHDARLLEQRAGELPEVYGKAKAVELRAKYVGNDSQVIDADEYTLN